MAFESNGEPLPVLIEYVPKPLKVLSFNFERKTGLGSSIYKMSLIGELEVHALLVRGEDAEELIGYPAEVEAASHLLILETKTLDSKLNRIYVPLDSGPEPESQYSEPALVISLLQNGVPLADRTDEERAIILDLYDKFLIKIGEKAANISHQVRQNDTLGQPVEILHFPYVTPLPTDEEKSRWLNQEKHVNDFPTRGTALLSAYNAFITDPERRNIPGIEPPVTGVIDKTTQVTVLSPQFKALINPGENHITSTYSTLHPFLVHFCPSDNPDLAVMLDISE